MSKKSRPFQGDDVNAFRPRAAGFFAPLRMTSRTASTLALAELESAAGAFAAVLFSFFHARVAGQESELPQHRPQIRIGLQQCFADSVAYGAGLAADSTAFAARGYVEPANR